MALFASVKVVPEMADIVVIRFPAGFVPAATVPHPKANIPCPTKNVDALPTTREAVPVVIVPVVVVADPEAL